MDTTRNGPLARNGAELRQGQVALETLIQGGPLVDRTSGRCPYGLGACCPLVEIVKGTMKRKRLTFWSNLFSLAGGVMLSVFLVKTFYF